MSQLVEEITNTDVKWNGNYVGLSPILTNDAAKRLIELGEQAIPSVLVALSDPDKFVTAHVILTQVSKVEYQAFPAWNGLVVDVAADGSVNIDPDQRLDLVRRWERWYQTKPRPKALPPGD
jgi:hypothetical protein